METIVAFVAILVAIAFCWVLVKLTEPPLSDREISEWQSRLRDPGSPPAKSIGRPHKMYRIERSERASAQDQYKGKSDTQFSRLQWVEKAHGKPGEWEATAERIRQRKAGAVRLSSGRRSIPAHVRRAVWRRDQGRCVNCGSRRDMEYDHIIPVSKGGGNTERNIELLCEECNRKKGARIAP